MVRRAKLKDHWQEQRLFLSRIVAAAIAVVLLTGLLITRLVELQVVDYQRFSDLSQGNRVRIEPLAPTRGLIYDRNGTILAENVPTWQLVAVPEQVEDLDAVLERLERLELLDPGNRPVLINLIRSHRRFERVTLANLTEAQAARFAVRRHRFPGIDIQEGLIRYYHFGEAIAHAVGYVGSIEASDLAQIDRADYAGSSQIGKTGIERAYESSLHGRAGYRQQVVNAQGRILLDPAARNATGLLDNSAIGGLETRWPEPGENLKLALDLELQIVAAEALAGMRGAAVAIDPRNGDVLTLVSAPSFDPNRFANGLSGAEFVELTTNNNRPLFNRALAGQYEPGSTVKPFLGLAGLHYETEHVSHDHFCTGEFRLPGNSRRYRESRAGGHGEIDLHSAIVRSCNVYFYGLAVELDIDRMEQFMKSFGFGARTNIDIAGEAAALMPGREWKRNNFTTREQQVWFPGETVNVGIGQGFTQVTPIQLAHATAALAANGQRFQPRLLIGIEDAETGAETDEPPIVLPPVAGVDAEHWAEVQAAMLGVTAEPRGTGFAPMQGATYAVAGKTGTAQEIGIAQDGEYDEEAIEERFRDNGLFIAYAPAEAPTIAIAVVVENNGGGSRTA
ncbi:MAG: penicillin-binding protein 2, partial [Gammaproteobacteria bacterium]|nr:penicillin-binding protein 2 [Gammaproteobacteria bacterium]